MPRCYPPSCLHVVAGAASITIRDAQGHLWRPMAVTIDGDRDLAVLRFARNVGCHAIPFAPPESVYIGDPVYVIGDPMGLTATLSTGIVSALRQEAGVPYVQTTAAISPESSGGPVLDARGRAVGVVRSFLKEGQNLNLAVHTTAVQSLLARHKFAPVEMYYGIVGENRKREARSAALRESLITELGFVVDAALNWDDDFLVEHVHALQALSRCSQRREDATTRLDEAS